MIRVRFAPSPTGNLHIGGVRTALFNFLFAKNNNGKFILRIEDTDTLRSKKEYEDNIIESLKWLKMDWDELYRQSERMNLYKEYVKKIIDSGYAYKCFCTKEELAEKRKFYEAKKLAYKYDGKCRNLTEGEIKQLKDEGRPFAIRFKIPEGTVEINDLIRGKITFNNNELDDIVIQRTDEIPTYNFCVVLDDALMEITHVMRGEDHISNTPRQILLYQALGFKLPEFAHIPLILAEDKSRLSKRQGAVAVTDYKDKGYLSETVINFLALLGASYEKDKEIFSLEELIQKFDLSKVNKSPAVFDLDKLNYLNGYYIRQKKDEEVAELIKPFLQKYNLSCEEEKLKQIIKLEKERLKKLEDIVDEKYFFTDEISYDKDAVQKYFKDKNVLNLLKEYTTALEKIEIFDASSLEKFTREFLTRKNLKLKDLVHPVRLTLTGKLVSAGLFELMEVLGKETCIKRLKIQLTF
ncbi:MAG: glutamate--tRNA ligase [Candidatus Firestonebacteria bacterium]